MGTVWHVAAKNSKVREIETPEHGSSNHFDFPFLMFYMKDLIDSSDTILFPEHIVLYLDSDIYAMQYVLGFRNLLVERGLNGKNIQMTFISENTILAKTCHDLFLKAKSAMAS